MKTEAAAHRHTLHGVFQGAAPETCEALASSAAAVRLRKGQKLFSVGEAPRSVYVLVEGCLKVVRQGPEGEAAITGILKPRDLIGIREVCLGSHYTRTSVALLESVVLAVDAAVMSSCVKQDPVLGQCFMRFFAREIVRLEQRLDARLHATAFVRVAHTMAQLQEMFGTAGEAVFRLPLNRRDIAELADVTPETVSRALSEMKDMGILQASGASIRVLDGGALRAACT